MIPCPKGAIVNCREMQSIESALLEAIESMRAWIDSETRPNRKFHDAEYRRTMRERRKILKLWEGTLKVLQRVRKAKHA